MISLLRSALGVCRLVKDSRGNKSWAHTLAVPASILTFLKWFVGGMTISWPAFGAFGFTVPAFTFLVPVVAATEAAVMLGVWLVYLGQREWADKKFNGQTSPPSDP